MSDDMPMFTDPAVVVAISVCWLSRFRKAPSWVDVATRHSQPCAFCDYPPSVLMDYINDFNNWVKDGSTEAGRVMFQWRRFDAATQRTRVGSAAHVAVAS